MLCAVSKWWLNASERPFHFLIKALCFHCTPQPGSIKAVTVYLSAHTHTEQASALTLHPTLPQGNARVVLNAVILKTHKLNQPHASVWCVSCFWLAGVIVSFSICLNAWGENAAFLWKISFFFFSVSQVYAVGGQTGVLQRLGAAQVPVPSWVWRVAGLHPGFLYPPSDPQPRCICLHFPVCPRSAHR